MGKIRRTDARVISAKPGAKAGNPFIDRFYEDSARTPRPGKRFSYPTTKFEDIFHFYSSIKAEENSYYARVESGLNPLDAEVHLRKRIGMIREEYSHRLNPEDFHSLDSLEGVRNLLYQTLFFRVKDIEESIQHESKHADEIRKLGYAVSGFGCWLCLDSTFKPQHFLSTSMKAERMIPKEDYRRITKAGGESSRSIDGLCRF